MCLQNMPALVVKLALSNKKKQFQSRMYFFSYICTCMYVQPLKVGILLSWVPLSFQLCLRLEPNDRPYCSDLLKHVCFTHDDFHTKFTIELRDKVIKEMEANPLLKGLGVTIHGSAHEYLQQQAEAQGIDRSHSEKDIGKEVEEEGGKKERVKKGERKKYGPKPKRKVGEGEVEGANEEWVSTCMCTAYITMIYLSQIYKCLVSAILCSCNAIRCMMQSLQLPWRCKQLMFLLLV